MKISIVLICTILLGLSGWYLYGKKDILTVSQGNVVFSPKQGDTLYVGETYTLGWRAGETGDLVHIFLINMALVDYGASVSISDRIYSVPNTHSYRYTVPTSTPAGSYKLQIGTAESGEFTIVSK